MSKIFRNIIPYWKSVIIILVLLIIQASCSLSLPQYTSDIIDTGIQNYGVEHILPEKIALDEYEYAQLFMTKDEAETFRNCYKKAGNSYTRTVSEDEQLDKLDRELIVPITMDYSISFLSIENFLAVLSEQIPEGNELLASDAEITYKQIEQLEQILGVGLIVYKEQENNNGETIKVKGIDARPLLVSLRNGTSLPVGEESPTTAKISEEKLLALRENMDEKINTIGYDLLKSQSIAYAIDCNKECGVDVNALQTNYLWISGLKMILVAILLTCASVSVGFFASRVGASIGRDLRGNIFKKVVSFSNKEIEQFSTASLITRSTNDIQQIQMVTTMLLRMALFAPVISIGSIIKVMSTGSQMAWVIVIAVITIAVAVGILITVAMPKFKLMQKLIDNVNLIAREILTGIPVIRAFKREEHEEKRFDKANTDLTKTTLFTNRVMTFMSPIMMFVMYSTSILIVWVASGHIDEGTMQVGEMTAFITYSMHIVMSFLVLTIMSIMLPRAAVAAARIDEVLKTESSIVDCKKPESLSVKHGIVEFSDVYFKYPGADENALEGISFSAKPGETTAFIGSTGSGKTTLVNLIPRLYDVTEGKITIDGCDIRNVPMKSLRDAIGYVPQKGILFSGTIESNIKFADKNISDERMKKSAEIAQASEFIEEKPHKYKNTISQGGTNVSGGQKQRLSIARAIAKNPKIYIFDDSFSALDMKTDAILRDALSNHVKNSTVMIVAQRISTIINANKIIVLDEGKIAGMGTHKELLSSCPAYLEIAKSQLSPKELGIEEASENE